MAEKEERIGITKFKETETPDFELCAYHIITRQDAISEMAYAMLKADDQEAANEWLQLQWNSTRIRKHYMVMAEAALNALLGDDK